MTKQPHLHLTHDERPELGGAFYTLRTPEGGPVAIVLDPDQDTVPDNDVAAAEKSNAERLRDCWNALADKESVPVSLNNRELASILGALRCIQGPAPLGPTDTTIDDILTDGGTLKPLSDEEIDALCVRLNS